MWGMILFWYMFVSSSEMCSIIYYLVKRSCNEVKACLYLQSKKILKKKVIEKVKLNFVVNKYYFYPAKMD